VILEKWVTATLIIFFGCYIFLAGDIYLDFWGRDESFNARTIPYLIGSIGLLCSFVLVYSLIWIDKPVSVNLKVTSEIKRIVWLTSLVALYISLLELLGFIPSSVLFLTLSAYLLGERRIWLLLITGIAMPLLLWGILTFLDIYLSPGTWVLQVKDLLL
jgi:putative tricarboxylic transport membrane protein